MTDGTLEAFLRDYTKGLLAGTAAVFVGAGLSRAAGFVDWKGLLRDVAEELGLNVDKETDLVAVAQYHVNKYGGRHHLNQLLIDEFTKDAEFTPNHELVASLPLDTVWTTNYDDLLERAYEGEHKRVDVKRSVANLALTVPRRAVTIYKMHGDKTMPDEAVLTKEDYESYDEKRQLFSVKLKGDLVEKTFLFLGFSFMDPNIDYILSRIRLLLGTNQRQHYCIMKKLDKPRSKSPKAKAEYEYEKARLNHRIEDLKRYRIKAILIETYSEITEILSELSRRSHLRDVFVSGSLFDYQPLGQHAIEEFCRLLGYRLMNEGYNLVSGFGNVIGGLVVTGAIKALRRNEDDRLILRPFPQNVTPDFWQRYREAMIQRSGTAVFISGNKKDASGNPVVADGVIKEYEIARNMKRFVIPVGATGYAAKQLWDLVVADLNGHFPQGGVKAQLQTIGNSKKSPQQLVDAVMGILKHVAKQRGA